jgi:phosphoglycolate phosphatase
MQKDGFLSTSKESEEDNIMSDIVLLDLDGTLLESGPGIVASVRYVYETLGIQTPEDKILQGFMGPPIIDSFACNGVPDDLLDRSVELYRSVYTQPHFPDPEHPGELVPGMYVGNAFPHILDACDEMKADGYTLAIATAKPEPQSYPVCEHFGIMSHLDALYGASLDSTRRHKDDVIRYALEGLHFNSHTDRVVMVGDRLTDIDGAAACGIETIGVRWGYAIGNELEEHGAAMFADTPQELPEVVRRYFSRTK